MARRHGGKSAYRRFWEKVHLSGGPSSCWEWTGTTSRDGYGRFWFRRRFHLAHRIALEIKLGRALEAEMFSCHTCHNPCCVNPRHLYEGTPQSNMVDKKSAGRAASGTQNGYHTHPEKRRIGTGFSYPRRPEQRVCGDKHGRRKLSEAQVVEIRALLASGCYTRKQIAQRFDVCWETIWKIDRGLIWKTAQGG